MKKSLLFICSVACLLFLVFVYPIQSREKVSLPSLVKGPNAGKPVKLFIRKLHCEKTTEGGQDEVYLIVAGRDKTGNFQSRLPADVPHEEAGHWNLNDGRRPRDVQNIVLWTGNLEDGESANMVVLGMEEDGGVPGGYAALAGAALRKIPNPATQAVGSVVGLVGVLRTYL